MDDFSDAVKHAHDAVGEAAGMYGKSSSRLDDTVRKAVEKQSCDQAARFEELDATKKNSVYGRTSKSLESISGELAAAVKETAQQAELRQSGG